MKKITYLFLLFTLFLFSYDVTQAAYTIEDGVVYYDNEILEEADADTLEKIGCCVFAKDKDHVFVSGKILEGADPATCEKVSSLSTSYCWDKNNVYSGSVVLEDADRNSFEVLPGDFYAKDKNTVYIGYLTVPSSDPASFEIIYLENTSTLVNYAKDKNNVYFSSSIVAEADPETFKVVTRGHNGQSASINSVMGIDKANLFYNGKKVEGFDLASLEKLTGGYLKDKHGIWGGIKEIKKIEGYFKLADKVYFNQNEMKGVDLATFEILENFYAKDKNNTYYHGKSLNQGLKINNSSLYLALKGRIIIRVEENGEAYYIKPDSQQMFFLARPDDAFRVMREQGVGVSELSYEAFNGYAPARLSGTILLRVEQHGEAYYVNPVDLTLHYLGRPNDAFGVMRELGLGISNGNFDNL